ncbi:MAG TPA: GNAT family N-acetyltransferase [Candidatus Eisenbergiella merdipullorum]|uniref:GNAT family N-acetyltransferase n=1 Tax=Candidatus Eisenbergiella merdipullorum TaxID=2838553 RepID=A0A9D2I9T1_9FIRM|nr:GNAT family N-acetyltransferase [Candidatus Eisenbergiella merdipullorum]
MLEKVRIAIADRSQETVRKTEELKKRLQADGIITEVYPILSLPAAGRNTPPELYLTDCPEKVRRVAGENCCILLYLDEKSRKLSFHGLPCAVEDLEGIDADYLEKVYRRHVGEPWEILRTPRLTVREQKAEDLDSLYEIYAHPDMTAYMEGLSSDKKEELERLQSYIRSVYPLYGFGLWMLERKVDGVCIGRAGFFWREGAEYPELGFAVKKSEQQKGYCLEACRAILDHGFYELDFQGVQALTREGNRAAEAVLERLGFRNSGFTEADGARAVRWLLSRPQ